MYVPTWKAVQYRKNGYSTELEQVVHTHGTSIIPCLMGWPRGLNLNRHPWLFTSVSVVSNARFYVLIYFCCVPKTCSHCEEEWQKPILSYFKIDACRNLHSYVWTESLSVWFSFLRKRHPVQCEPFSSPEPVVSWSQQIKPSGSGDENECEHNLAPEEPLFVAFFQGSEGKLEASMERSTPASRFLCSPENPAKIMLVLHTTEHAALS